MPFGEIPTTCSIVVRIEPLYVVVGRVVPHTGFRVNVSCVSAAFTQYQEDTHGTHETGPIRVPRPRQLERTFLAHDEVVRRPDATTFGRMGPDVSVPFRR